MASRGNIGFSSGSGNKNSMDFLKNLKLENKAKAYSSGKTSFIDPLKFEEEEKRVNQEYADHLIEHYENWNQISQSTEKKTYVGSFQISDTASAASTKAPHTGGIKEPEEEQYPEVQTKPFEEEDWGSMLEDVSTAVKLKEALKSVLRAKLYE